MVYRLKFHAKGKRKIGSVASHRHSARDAWELLKELEGKGMEVAVTTLEGRRVYRFELQRDATTIAAE
ncbi:hypothetical protein ACLBXM_02760 [Xanthobacteraceae bacterium A53D]